MTTNRDRARETRITAVLAIGALVGWAIYLGYNGVTLSLGLMAIAGIAGYGLGVERMQKIDDWVGGDDG